MADVNDQVDADQLAGVRKLLERLPMQVDRYLSETPQPYAAGSRAAEEGEVVGGETINTVVTVARLSILSTGDHMVALDRALSAPTLTFSPWAISRTVLEAAARGSWVLDPEIEWIERIARVLSLRFADVREQVNVARSYHKKDPSMMKGPLDFSLIEKDGRTRKSEIIKQAENLGILVKRKSNKVTKIGPVTVEPKLNITNIVQTALRAESDYSILSGLGHQNPTFLRSFSMKEMQDGSGVFGTSLDASLFLYLVISSLGWYGITAWRHFIYCGLDTDILEGLLTETAVLARMRERFWEQPEARP